MCMYIKQNGHFIVAREFSFIREYLYDVNARLFHFGYLPHAPSIFVARLASGSSGCFHLALCSPVKMDGGRRVAV